MEHCKLQNENGRAFHIATMQAVQARDSRWTLPFHRHRGAAGPQPDPNAAQRRGRRGHSQRPLSGARRAIDRSSHRGGSRPGRIAKATNFITAFWPAAPTAFSTGKFLSGRTRKKPTPSKPTATCCLSDNAIIDTKPQLEIFADDVKCTHGATVGQLNEEALFYLRSRGIGAAHGPADVDSGLCQRRGRAHHASSRCGRDLEQMLDGEVRRAWTSASWPRA